MGNTWPNYYTNILRIVVDFLTNDHDLRDDRYENHLHQRVVSRDLRHRHRNRAYALCYMDNGPYNYV